MDYCVEELLPITKALLWLSGILGVFHLIASMPFRDAEWKPADVRRGTMLSGVAVAAGMLSGISSMTGAGDAFFAWIGQSMARTACLLLIGATLTVLTAWVLAKVIFLHRIHTWLGRREELVVSRLSGEALRTENEEITSRIAAGGRHALLGAVSIALLVALWIAISGRCDPAAPTSTTTSTPATSMEDET